MNSLKRFVLGFLLGVGLMYWYLHNTELGKSDTVTWMSGAVTDYRGDKEHDAARQALGEK